MSIDPIYNEYVTGEVDYHEDISLREWEYYALYAEEDIDHGEEE